MVLFATGLQDLARINSRLQMQGLAPLSHSRSLIRWLSVCFQDHEFVSLLYPSEAAVLTSDIDKLYKIQHKNENSQERRSKKSVI